MSGSGKPVNHVSRQSDNLRSTPCVNIKQPIRLRLFIISSSNGDFYHNIANVSFSGIQAGSSLCLKCARTCLTAGLRPDPLGELKRSPRPPSRNEGPTSKGKGWGDRGGDGRRMGKGAEGRRRERRGRGEAIWAIPLFG